MISNTAFSGITSSLNMVKINSIKYLFEWSTSLCAICKKEVWYYIIFLFHCYGESANICEWGNQYHKICLMCIKEANSKGEFSDLDPWVSFCLFKRTGTVLTPNYEHKLFSDCCSIQIIRHNSSQLYGVYSNLRQQKSNVIVLKREI